MKKNDKLIVIAGVIILVIASIGIYTYVPSKATAQNVTLQDFNFNLKGQYANSTPSAIAVSSDNAFYPLIATPLAVHYSTTGSQTIIPLYVENLTTPSTDVTRTMNDEVKIPVNLILDNTQTAEQWSIQLAQTYWTKSQGALVIENSYQGYTLGVLATPIASYLSIPIIITSPNSNAAVKVLADLGVKNYIVCGDNLTQFTGNSVLHLYTVDDVVEAETIVIHERFNSTDYLVITNPLDAYPPTVIAQQNFTIGPLTVRSQATTMLLNTVKGMIAGKGNIVGSFTIPDDYKYALVKFRGYNLETKNIDLLGDDVVYFVGPDLPNEPPLLQQYECYAGGTNMGGQDERDASGNIISESTYSESVLYDRGGVSYEIRAVPTWLAQKTGQIKCEITVQSLTNSLYPLMPKLSSMAPYLAAYHQGIIFGRPEFAFAASDDTLALGQPSPGFWLPARNPRLAPASNAHVFQIHEEINALLANLADITITKPQDLQQLRDYYAAKPIYIAMVGDGTMLPMYLYNSSIEPITVEETGYFWGGGIPSDFIYADIDPNPGDWSNQARDLYSPSPEHYPYQENIIGRITGWDAQDVSALLARTVFYDKIISDMGTWKDTAAVMLGGGNDFQEPLVRYKIFGDMLGMVKGGEPMKLTTGASMINGMTVTNNVKQLGFDTTYIRENKAAYQGFSDEAIKTLKKANLLSRLMMSERQMRQEVGADVIQGKSVQENSNFIFANAHGNQHLFSMSDVGVTSLGLGLPKGPLHKFLVFLVSIIGYGPGTAMQNQVAYSPRHVETMKLGPSFMWIESCICGKLDGMSGPQSITQTYLHSGMNAVISSTTSSNIAGGYLNPKNSKYDLPGQTFYRYLINRMKVARGDYPDLHFGFKIYSDTLSNLQNGSNLGLALRDARNQYLPEDAEWAVWWSPPLTTTTLPGLDAQLYKNTAKSSALEPRLDNKFQSFFEYHIYGDPAFTPYIPNVVS
jgi:hypothetical protein